MKVLTVKLPARVTDMRKEKNAKLAIEDKGWMPEDCDWLIGLILSQELCRINMETVSIIPTEEKSHDPLSSSFQVFQRLPNNGNVSALTIRLLHHVRTYAIPKRNIIPKVTKAIIYEFNSTSDADRYIFTCLISALCNEKVHQIFLIRLTWLINL